MYRNIKQFKINTLVNNANFKSFFLNSMLYFSAIKGEIPSKQLKIIGLGKTSYLLLISSIGTGTNVRKNIAIAVYPALL